MPNVTRPSGMRPIAQEYLIVVGSPSNMFNGYVFIDNQGRLLPVVPPRSIDDIRAYTRGTPEQKHFTHDLFWANFLYSAVVLIESGRVRPKAGDILTLAVFWPGLEARDALDYEASPYNSLNAASPFVLNRFPYDRSVRGAEKGNGTNRNPRIGSSRGTPRLPPPTEREINHDILMREVDDRGFNGGFSKYSLRRFHHIDLVQNIPLRIAFGLPGIGYMEAPPEMRAPPLKRVLIKLLMIRNIDDLGAYVRNGSWTGERWTHPLDLRNETSPANGFEQSTWFAVANPGSSSHPDWSLAPGVDRARVKVRRLDYFGHSGDDALFLQYGTTNQKGEEPVGEIELVDNQVAGFFGPNSFTPDAFAHLWGCSLAVQFARTIAQLTETTIASQGLVNYEDILDAPRRLPEPSDPINFPFITVSR